MHPPLNLSNSDTKIITKLFDLPMAESVSVMVNHNQFGFIRGRRLHDAVLCLESWALTYSVSAPASAGNILLDQKAAFPSIAHEFLFFVLLEIGIPGVIVNAIRLLYDNNEAIVSFLGCRTDRVLLRRGIKQGCPLSGSMWAICFDPVMRLLMVFLPVPRNYLSGYADDLAFACYNVFEAIMELQAIMGTISATTGLELNYPKVVIIPVGTLELDTLAAFVASLSSGFATVKVALSAKYLGLMFGPGAHSCAGPRRPLHFIAGPSNFNFFSLLSPPGSGCTICMWPRPSAMSRAFTGPTGRFAKHSSTVWLAWPRRHRMPSQCLLLPSSPSWSC